MTSLGTFTAAATNWKLCSVDWVTRSRQSRRAARLSPEVADLKVTVEVNHEVSITACEGLTLIVSPIPPIESDILGLLIDQSMPKHANEPASQE